MTLAADLRLRFADVRLPARVYLPSPSTVVTERAPLVFWLAASNAGDVLCRELSAACVAVVLELAGSDSTRPGYQLVALGWAVEHAPEFGARAGGLVVAGHRAGATRAARLAVEARDAGWPVVRRQLLVHPALAEPELLPIDVAGTAPATILTTGALADVGSRYAATLRGGGVEVQELVFDPRRALPLHELARALR